MPQEAGQTINTSGKITTESEEGFLPFKKKNIFSVPDFYNCKEYAAGNATAISHYSFLGRIHLKMEPSLTMECDHIRRRVMGNTVYKRVKHPYAVARNVFAVRI